MLILSVCLSAAGCGTLRPIDPQAGPIELREGDGLVVLQVTTDLPLDSIRISGFKAAEDLEPGTHLLILAATPGSYVLESLSRQVLGLEGEWSIFRAGRRVRFDVRPGQINYPGLLIVEGVGESPLTSFYISYRIVNRSSMLMNELDERFPGLRIRYPLRYASGRDPFIEAFAQANDGGAASKPTRKPGP